MARLLLEAKEISLFYGDREVLGIDRLCVYDGERIGLIGQNGAGKSTLLAILAGEKAPDAGTVRRLCDAALIPQQGEGAEASDWRLRALFRTEEAREGLSGGEMTRRRIAAALSGPARLLLADEPTTDLDGEGLSLLEEQLEAFPGAVVLISHDRTLLRRLCGRIWCLEEGRVTDFPGDYDGFMAERDRQKERARFEYDRYRAEQARLKESAQRMAERASGVRKAPARMGNSEARLHKREATDAVLRLSHAKRTLQNRMEQMEVKERPREEPQIRMTLGAGHPIGARMALEVRIGCLDAGGKTLLEETAMSLPTGSRTALQGENGCGKTSLLSVLAGQVPKGIGFSGEVKANPGLRLGWFDQHHARTLDREGTVLENITRASLWPESMARTVLARLGFSREDAFKPVSLLSGGETAKTALARLLLLDCNALMLDEPTNHLDLFTMEALEELLCGYGGTLLFVSHDRAFVRRTATRLVRFEGGKLRTFEGTAGEQERQERQRQEGQERQELRMAAVALEMRLAALAGRMSSPRKGDRPDQLNEEYRALSEELRALRRRAGDL